MREFVSDVLPDIQYRYRDPQPHRSGKPLTDDNLNVLTHLSQRLALEIDECLYYKTQELLLKTIFIEQSDYF